jgi:hypothetical protein
MLGGGEDRPHHRRQQGDAADIEGEVDRGRQMTPGAAWPDTPNQWVNTHGRAEANTAPAPMKNTCMAKPVVALLLGQACRRRRPGTAPWPH